MVTRRQFLGAVGVGGAAGFLAPFLDPKNIATALEAIAESNADDRSPQDLARDESFWFRVQQAFTADRTLINLNNGGVSPSPASVQNAMKRYLDYSNTAPPYSMWRVLEPQRETVRERLAGLFGCDTEEIAITRNASESLQTCEFGFDLAAGDEVITTDQDYPRMVNTFLQRERREGIVMKQIALPVPAEDPAEVVRRFEAAITTKTRLILMCHVINLTGQILPVRDVVAMARKRGIPVIVDGAHAFAHFEFKHEDLDCDYYATSLHKWLFAPHGTGMLYVRRDRIGSLWPLMAASEGETEDIRKFEQIGTHPAANALAIGEAITFHEGLGIARKEARLRHLRDLWARRLIEQPRIRLHTSLDPRFSCGIATVEMDGIAVDDLCTHLWAEHRILTCPIKHAQFEGLRISSSVYTTLSELEQFCGVMERVARDGLPG